MLSRTVRLLGRHVPRQFVGCQTLSAANIQTLSANGNQHPLKRQSHPALLISQRCMLATYDDRMPSSDLFLRQVNLHTILDYLQHVVNHPFFSSSDLCSCSIETAALTRILWPKLAPGRELSSTLLPASLNETWNSSRN